MGRQKQQAEAKQDEELDQAAAANLDELEGVRQPEMPTEPSTSLEPVPVAATDFKLDILFTLLRGVQIHVPHGEEPSATADKLIKLHQELMLKAKQAGIIE